MAKIVDLECKNTGLTLILDSEGNLHDMSHIGWGPGYWVRVRDALVVRGVVDTDKILPTWLIDPYDNK